MYTLIRTPDYELYLCERDETGSLNIWNAAGENLAQCPQEPQSYVVIQAIAHEFRRIEGRRQRRRWLGVLAVVSVAIGFVTVTGALARSPVPETNSYVESIELSDWLSTLQ
ncbi:hypothetical protein [Leptolyngbya sp. FACHB-261]|uniref:hypothetical protein n=1 Tax=Leptolyngbya sp. FACHB-261 TaxID=2692806 RepID=UPI001684D783|nr:hypothetical protein [Leptolyngbya sp. FACHB-261]MBD2104881.1 hypothetical protein [Leptolyngbya sp. FACHB-261]